MDFLALSLLLLAFTASSSGSWCVCKDGSETILQKTIDYACGAGADCNPIKQNGPCFQPNNVKAHCNYAVNSYFQRKGQIKGSCDFAGSATVTASDPSTTGCLYPASASIAGPGSGITTPTIGNSVDPSGGTNKDNSHGGLALLNTNNFFFPFSINIFLSLMMLVIMLW